MATFKIKNSQGQWENIPLLGSYKAVAEAQKAAQDAIDAVNRIPPSYTHLVNEIHRLVETPTLTKKYEFEYSGYGSQGCCTDGTYLYMAFPKSPVATSVVTKLIKVNLATGNVVLTVENYSYGHAADMCYNADDNCLYILDSGKTVYKVNASNLSFVSRITWADSLGGLSYNNQHHLFVGQLSGTKQLNVYHNTTYRKLYKIDVDNAPYNDTGVQAIDATGDLIYMVSSKYTDKGYNSIHVTDWKGHYYVTFNIDQLEEPQGLVVARSNNMFYVVDRASAANVWKTTVYTFTSAIETSARAAAPDEPEYLPNGTEVELYYNSNLTPSMTGDVINLNPQFRMDKFSSIEIVFNINSGSMTQKIRRYNNGGGNFVLYGCTASVDATGIVYFNVTFIPDEANNKLTVYNVSRAGATLADDGSFIEGFKTNNYSQFVIHRIIGIV